MERFRCSLTTPPAPVSDAGILGARGGPTGWVWYDHMPAAVLRNLPGSLKTICRPPRLPFEPEWLGRHRRARRKKPKSWLAHFDDRTQAVVRARYAGESELFGYSPD